MSDSERFTVVSFDERARERDQLRRNTAPKPLPGISVEHCLGQIVRAICNLAETIDAQAVEKVSA